MQCGAFSDILSMEGKALFGRGGSIYAKNARQEKEKETGRDHPHTGRKV